VSGDSAILPAAEPNRWVVAGAVMLSSFMVFLDTSVVNVSLPYIAGSLSASIDESTWALTSYLAANAVILPLAGWLANHFGRKRLMIWSVLTFTAASLLCGLAPTLPILVIFRVIQGLTGGVMMPLSQSVMLEGFPPHERGRAMGFWSVGIVLGPILGPVVGGFLTLNYSWRWVFYVNVPVGVLSLIMLRLYVFDPPYIQRREGKIDYRGIALLFLGIGALQLLLDKGQEEEWLDSSLIVGCLVVAVAGIVWFVIHELRVENPVVNLRVFGSITFAIGSFVSGMLGFLLFGSLIVLPILLQTLLGYSPLQAGLAMAPRGIGSMITMPLIGVLTDKIDPRRLLLAGFAIGAVTMYWLSRLSLDAGYWDFFWPQFIQGWALGLLFIPLTTLTMAPVPREDMGNASSAFNMVRNLGSSIGIAVLSTFMARSAIRHRAILAERFDEYDRQSRALLERMAESWSRHGADPVEAVMRAGASAAATITRQAQLLAYLDAFELLALVYLLMMPLVFVLRRPRIPIPAVPSRLTIGHE
jgi:DHA2 family multidrug resistance protein